MPVIVVGGDTPQGRAILEAMVEPDREVRAFVSDATVGADLRRLGVKVAVGDVSDETHVEGASTVCFTAVLVSEAARDGRERSFAGSEREVMEGWAAAVATAGVNRVIWVHDGEPPPAAVREVAVVDPSDTDLVQKVIDLDEAQIIES